LLRREKQLSETLPFYYIREDAVNPLNHRFVNNESNYRSIKKRKRSGDVCRQPESVVEKSQFRVGIQKIPLVETVERGAFEENSDKLGDVRIVSQLIATGAGINQTPGKSGRCPLIAACCGNRLEIVRLLLQCEGVDPDTTGRRGETGVMVACGEESVSVDVLRLLLMHRADPNRRDDDGNHPVIAAGDQKYRPHYEKLRVLLAHGGDLQARHQLSRGVRKAPTSTPRTLFETACLTTDVGLLRALVEAGGLDTNQQLFSNSRAIVCCHPFSPDYPQFLRLLLENDADVNYRNSKGETVLIMACTFDNAESVATILEFMPDIYIVDNYGCSAMKKSCINNSLQCMRLLLEHGVDTAWKDKFGKTVLMHAAMLGLFDVVKLLLEYFPDTCIQDNDGHTAADLCESAKIKQFIRQYQVDQKDVCVLK
jgi:ankyrin repeat protein